MRQVWAKTLAYEFCLVANCAGFILSGLLTQLDSSGCVVSEYSFGATIVASGRTGTYVKSISV